MSTNGTGPSKTGYWVGAAIMLVGIVGAVLWGVLGWTSFTDKVDGFQRVSANGQGEVTLDRTGGYVIYYEGPGADGGDVPEGRASVTSVETDEPLTLESYESTLSYNDGDRAGQAVITFDVETPGAYLVESESEGDGQLAIGRSIAGTLVTTIVGALALGGLGLVLGAIILIVTAVRRRRARSRAAPWYPPPPGGSGPPPPPPPPSPSGPPPPPGGSGPPAPPPPG